tara:strand:+ start:145 stop:723 length:579 start_codon:yes stop_codon:yes gene_type:complete
MIKNTLAILLVVALFGCATPEASNTEAERPSLYFDIEQLLNEQRELLAQEGLMLNKEVTVNGETETFEAMIANEKEWDSQFQLFYETNINKFGLVDAYSKETLSVAQGVRKDIFTSKKPSNVVKVMECTYQNGALSQVRIHVSDKNIIYKTEKEYLLHFDQGVFTGYSITADESMILKKDMKMKLVAEIAAN